MIEEQGRVVAIEGDWAEVRAERQGVCAACSVGNACGTSLLERWFNRHPARLMAFNDAGARLGEQVLIGIPERHLLQAAQAAYLVPALALIGGAILGDRLGGDYRDPAALAGGLLGLALAFQWLRRYSARVAGDPRHRPVVLRRLTGVSGVPAAGPALEVGVRDRPSSVA